MSTGPVVDTLPTWIWLGVGVVLAALWVWALW
jgi:hypothetical protein